MKYDYVIEKPSIDEALEHYGVKGMKWKKKKQQIDEIRDETIERKKHKRRVGDGSYENKKKVKSIRSRLKDYPTSIPRINIVGFKYKTHNAPTNASVSKLIKKKKK